MLVFCLPAVCVSRCKFAYCTCKGIFCFVCGAKLTEADHYRHFTGVCCLHVHTAGHAAPHRTLMLGMRVINLRCVVRTAMHVSRWSKRVLLLRA